MLKISQGSVKLFTLLLLVFVVGIIATHPHGNHSHGNKPAPNQQSHSHSHPQHETPDEPGHAEFTARLPGTSFVVSFTALNIISPTNVSDLISTKSAPHVIPEVTKHIYSTPSLTRVYIL